MYSVLTLGPVAVLSDSGEPIELPGMRSREVVAAIATGSGAPVARTKLWGWLWPELPKEQARKALNTEIWRLRKSVSLAGFDPDGLIASSPQDVRLCAEAGTRCDLSEFRDRLAGADTLDEMMSVARSYRGEFAEGLSSEWMEDVRRELRMAFLGLLNRIIHAALASDRLAEAQYFAEKMSVEEPYDEAPVRALMQAALAGGDRGHAAQTYRTFAERLRRDLDVEPTEGTLAIFRECVGEKSADEGLGAGSPGYRIEPAPVADVAVANARRKLLVIADLVTAIRRDLRAIARDLDTVGR